MYCFCLEPVEISSPLSVLEVLRDQDEDLLLFAALLAHLPTELGVIFGSIGSELLIIGLPVEPLATTRTDPSPGCRVIVLRLTATSWFFFVGLQKIGYAI